MRLPRTRISVPFVAAPLLALVACAPTPPSTPAGDPAAPTAETAIAAVVLAESNGGGRALSLEHDDGEWDVLVAAGESRTEVRVSADGTSVVSSDAQGALEADDRADLDAATTTLADAIRIAAAQGGEATGPDEVSIEGDAGARSWRVEFEDGSALDVGLSDGAVSRSAS